MTNSRSVIALLAYFSLVAERMRAEGDLAARFGYDGMVFANGRLARGGECKLDT